MKPFPLVFRFARSYMRPLILTVLSMLLLIGVQLFIPWAVKQLIDTISNNLAADAITFNYLTGLSLAVLGVFLVRGVLQFTRSYMAHVARDQ